MVVGGLHDAVGRSCSKGVKTMKKLVLIGLGLFVLRIEVAAAEEIPTILGFETMVGNHGPFIGGQNLIRGVPAGGAPWVVQEAAVGQLKQDGQLDVEVRGLVLESTRMNPVPNFRGLVSCLSIGDDGEVTTVNISTEDFPADPDGNSTITSTVELPSPCFAPIIFVTSPAGAWFAITGF
jgi:hypothetical protein